MAEAAEVVHGLAARVTARHRYHVREGVENSRLGDHVIIQDSLYHPAYLKGREKPKATTVHSSHTMKPLTLPDLVIKIQFMDNKLLCMQDVNC